MTIPTTMARQLTQRAQQSFQSAEVQDPWKKQAKNKMGFYIAMTVGRVHCTDALTIITASVTRDKLGGSWTLKTLRFRLQTYSHLTGRKPLCSCSPETLATLQTKLKKVQEVWVACVRFISAFSSESSDEDGEVKT